MKFTTEDKFVVVPWDFSDMSRESLTQAAEMVENISQIRVVHVTQFPPALEYGVIWETISEETITKNLNDSFANAIKDGSELTGVSFTVLFGDPGRQICDFAADNDAAIIVMPSHGRSGFSRMLLGSVAERVVRMAPCPVLVLRKPISDSHSEHASTKATSGVS